MSPAIAETILSEIAALRRQIALAGKLGFTAREAAEVTGVGRDEWYRRMATPATSPLHVRSVALGRKRVIPRREIERVLAEEAT